MIRELVSKKMRRLRSFLETGSTFLRCKCDLRLERSIRSALSGAACLFVAGCMNVADYKPEVPEAPLPYEGRASNLGESTGSSRLPPLQRLVWIDKHFRSHPSNYSMWAPGWWDECSYTLGGQRPEWFPEWLDNLSYRLLPDRCRSLLNEQPVPRRSTCPGSGCDTSDAFRWPRMTHPTAALAYLKLGKDFEAAGNGGGAVQAYWAAITLSNGLIAPRRDRAAIRLRAFRRLSLLAESRDEPLWAELLDLAAFVTGTYVTSRAAKEDQENFNSALRKLVEREGRLQHAAQQARSARRRQQILSGLQAGMQNVQNRTQSATGDTQAQIEQQMEDLQGQLHARNRASQQGRQLARVRSQGQAAVNEQAGQLLDVTASNVTAIQRGHAFVGALVARYLATANRPSVYLKLVWKYGRDKPRFAEILRKMKGALGSAQQDAGTYKPLLTEFTRIERFVWRFERNGERPGPKYFATVCDRGKLTECYLSARWLCGDGISEACQRLRKLCTGDRLAAGPAKAGRKVLESRHAPEQR